MSIIRKGLSRFTVTVLFISAALAGCSTTLSTYPVPKDQLAVAGIPYTLPALQYQLTVTRTLTDCASDAGGVHPEFGIKIEATPAYVEGETFVADYRKLSSGSKVTSIKIETYDNHTVKTINAEADDKGPEVVAGIASAGFAIARLALGLPAPADVGGGGPNKQPTCPAAIASNNKLVAALADKAKELSALNEQLEPYTTIALLATLTDADKQTISELRGKIRDASKAISEIQKHSDELIKKLSYTEKLDLDFRSGQADRSIPFPSTDPVIEALQWKWLEGLFGALDKHQRQKTKEEMTSLTATLRKIGGIAADDSICAAAGVKDCLSPKPTWKTDSGGNAPSSIPGIAYRQPVKVRLRICETPDGPLCASGGAKINVEATAYAPQLGTLVILPFRNGYGANNQLQAQFRADGSLDWASYADKRASALSSVNAVNNVLSQGLALSTAIQTKRTADDAAAKAKADAAAPLNAVKQQLDLAKAQKDLLDAQAALDPSNIAIKQQQAALDASVAQLTAQAAIQELEAKLSP